MMRSSKLSQLVEQRFRAFEVLRAEAFGEPAIDRREEVVGFGTSPSAIANICG
jgi:hypothetical protein